MVTVSFRSPVGASVGWSSVLVTDLLQEAKQNARLKSRTNESIFFTTMYLLRIIRNYYMPLYIEKP